MVRNSLFALTLLLAGTGAAFADTANDGAATQTVIQTQASSVVQPLPMHPGPYTTVYSEWSDLAG